MRNLILIATIALSPFISTHALESIHWDRPIAEARLQEFDSVGHELSQGFEKILYLNQKDDSKLPTGFTFSEEGYNACLLVYLPGQQCPLTKILIAQYQMESVTKNSCGTTIYKARELMNGVVTRSSTLLTVEDHRTDICDQAIPSLWEVKFSSAFTNPRILRGNPIRVEANQ